MYIENMIVTFYPLKLSIYLVSPVDSGCKQRVNLGTGFRGLGIVASYTLHPAGVWKLWS